MDASNALDLSAITVGAQVAWIEYGHGSEPQAYRGTVSRFTKTQIVVVTDQRDGHRTERFRRRDGRLIRSGTYGVFLLDPSHERVIQLRAVARFRGALRDIVTLANAIDCRSPGPAEDQLNKIIELAEHAALDLLIT